MRALNFSQFIAAFSSSFVNGDFPSRRVGVGDRWKTIQICSCSGFRLAIERMRFREKRLSAAHDRYTLFPQSSSRLLPSFHLPDVPRILFTVFYARYTSLFSVIRAAHVDTLTARISAAATNFINTDPANPMTTVPRGGGGGPVLLHLSAHVPMATKFFAISALRNSTLVNTSFFRWGRELSAMTTEHIFRMVLYMVRRVKCIPF